MNRLLIGKAMLGILVLATTSGAAQAATDGTPGASSTGTFTATVTANAPVGTQVEIAGLADFNFAPVVVDNVPTSGAQTVTDNFCLARSTQGDINVTVTQAGIPPGSEFNLNTGGNGEQFIPVSLFRFRERQNNQLFPVTKSGDSFNAPRGAVDCANGTDTSYELAITIPTTVNSATAGAGGNFSGLFTLVLAPL